MYDKILQTKKEMKNVIKSNGLTRFEKYNLVKEKSRTLSESERDILIKECHRDYEIYDRAKDIKELITFFLTGIGMLITVFGIYFEDKILNYIQFYSVLTIVGMGIAMSVIIVSLIQSWRSKNLTITRYMIDVLEENK